MRMRMNDRRAPRSGSRPSRPWPS